jgi:hypothetical protein
MKNEWLRSGKDYGSPAGEVFWRGALVVDGGEVPVGCDCDGVVDGVQERTVVSRA